MRGIPWRLPYWPCDRRPMDSPASRSSLVSWSESNESAIAQRAPPFHTAGRSARPARTRPTISRQCSSGHCQGCRPAFSSFMELFFHPDFPGKLVVKGRFLSYQPRELGPRLANGLESLRLELAADLGIGERLHHLGVD